MSPFVTAAPLLDAIELADIKEPDVERVHRTWYARSPQAVLDNPAGLPASIVEEIRRWVFDNPDENVRQRRPFCFDGCWSWDWFFRKDFAPRWWVDASREWSLAHGFDHRGVRVRRR